MEKKYYAEDELVQMYQDGRISLVEYISMHSVEWKKEYETFCMESGVQADEKSAMDFLDMKGEPCQSGQTHWDITETLHLSCSLF